jgi:hypothetical protein
LSCGYATLARRSSLRWRKVGASAAPRRCPERWTCTVPILASWVVSWRFVAVVRRLAVLVDDAADHPVASYRGVDGNDEQCSKPVDEVGGRTLPTSPKSRNRVRPARQRGSEGYARAHGVTNVEDAPAEPAGGASLIDEIVREGARRRWGRRPADWCWTWPGAPLHKPTGWSSPRNWWCGPAQHRPPGGRPAPFAALKLSAFVIA